jgi:hemerythrin
MMAFIRDSLLTNYSKIFNEVNYLLKATTNPKKLAHLRCIINSLFNSISDHYSKS